VLSLFVRYSHVIVPVEYLFSTKGEQEGILKTIEPIAKNAAGEGFINIFTDKDGVTRKVPLNLKEHKSFVEKVYETAIGKEFQSEEKLLIINYVGIPGTYKRYSLSDIKNINLTDKIVFIGATSPDLHDDYLVPISEGKRMPGVELHANTLQTMITQNFLKHQSKGSLILFIFLLAISLGLLLEKIKPLYATLITLPLILLYLVIVINFFEKGIILNIIYPILTIILAYAAVLFVNYIVEKKGRKYVTDMLGKYVSTDVADELLKLDKIDLHGEEKYVTILFADIRGFTSMSEKMTPHEVVDMLNIYLGDMTEAIFDNKGTLDKYIGDEIMAIFGAPVYQEDHAIKAVQAALDMQEAVKKVQKKNGTKTPKVKVGIGINSGNAVIGNIGYEKRLDYTAIGDTVNLGARLCSAAEPDQVIISEETYNLVKEHFKTTKLPSIKVKGKEKVVNIYSVEEAL